MGCDASLEGWMHRATAFELLALAFLMPSRDIADALVAGEYAAACSELFEVAGCDGESSAEVLRLLAAYEGDSADQTFHVMRHEYTHLFIGERQPLVTPYIGIRAAQKRGQRGLFFVGKETVDIEHFMLRCGVAKDLAAGQVNDPVDHVGTVCEFLKFLCLVNAQAVQASPNSSVEEGDFQLFLDEHFREYAEWFAEQVIEHARIPFYRAAALLLKTVIALPVPESAA